MVILSDFSQAYSHIHLPAKVVLAVTSKPDGGYNLITLEWYMRTSIQPAMFAISIGLSRFSHECLQKNRFFNLVFPSNEMKSLLSMCGSESGRDTDKFAQGNVSYLHGKLNKLPVLKDAVANFECSVVSQILSGDHTIFIGQVHYAWLNDEKQLFFYPNH